MNDDPHDGWRRVGNLLVSFTSASQFTYNCVRCGANASVSFNQPESVYTVSASHELECPGKPPADEDTTQYRIWEANQRSVAKRGLPPELKL